MKKIIKSACKFSKICYTNIYAYFECLSAMTRMRGIDIVED